MRKDYTMEAPMQPSDFRERDRLEGNPTGCEYCANEPEPGWIETDNNGPIVPCPICRPATPTEDTP